MSEETQFIPKPDAVGQAGVIGENRKVGLSVGTIGKDGFTKDNYYCTDGSSKTVSPKGVPLKFIEGEWVEPLAKQTFKILLKGMPNHLPMQQNK